MENQAAGKLPAVKRFVEMLYPWTDLNRKQSAEEVRRNVVSVN